MNKPVYLGLSVLDLSKTLLYKFWYGYIKRKYNINVKLRYVDIDSFIADLKTNGICKDIATDVEIRFYSSNFKIDRQEKIKKITQLMKNELGAEIIK